MNSRLRFRFHCALVLLLTGGAVSLRAAGRLHSPQVFTYGVSAETGLGVSGIAVSQRSERLLLAQADAIKSTGLSANSESVSPGSVTAKLDVASTTGLIEAWTFATRESEANGLEMRLEASGRALELLRGQKDKFKDEKAAADFAAALHGAEMADKRLRLSLKAARSATDQKWDEARAAVASDFKEYADAVARAEAAAKLGGVHQEAPGAGQG